MNQIGIIGLENDNYFEKFEKLFGFIEDVLQTLEEKKMGLNQVAEEIESFFENLLIEAEKGYLNINSRVKSAKSLKEKIIRNQYYQKYNIHNNRNNTKFYWSSSISNGKIYYWKHFC